MAYRFTVDLDACPEDVQDLMGEICDMLHSRGANFDLHGRRLTQEELAFDTLFPHPVVNP